MGGRHGTSIVCILALSICLSSSPISAEDPILAEEREFEIIRTIPHLQTSFTQGLEVFGESIFESSGLYGESRLSEIDRQNGEIIRQIEIDQTYFAEGITVIGQSIILLTWKEGVALEIDISTFSVIGNFTFDGEGWGICFNGEHLVMSNGTSELSFRDPETFAINHTISVYRDGIPVSNLNELECLGESILANVWMEDNILSIDSESGHVDYYFSLASMAPEEGEDPNEVLNGIAFDKSTGGFWVTGKNWTKIYLVEIYEVENKYPVEEPINQSQAVPYSILAIFAIILFFRPIHLKNEPETPNFKDPTP